MKYCGLAMYQEKTSVEYLILLISVFLICVIVKQKHKLKLFKSAKEGGLVFGALFVIGSALDSFALFRGNWSYDEKFLVGIRIGVMPMEEYLFMIVIPFLTLIVYRMARGKNQELKNNSQDKLIAIS